MRGDGGARGDEAEAGEAVEDDLGEEVPVADDPGEDAHEEGLLDQAGDDVVVGAPDPEERGEGDVDDDERRGEERHLAAEQTEAAVDVAGEDVEETVDDAGAVHGTSRRLRGCGATTTAQRPWNICAEPGW